MLHFMRRSGGYIAAALATLALAACSANGTGGVNSGGVNAGSRIKQAPVVNLAISPTNVAAGGDITLTWSSTNSTTCVGTGALAGENLSLNQDNGVTIKTDKIGTWTYGIICHGPGGTDTASVVVTVGTVPPPTITYDIFPAAFPPGGQGQITWATTNATACTGTGGTGSDGWDGAQPTQNITGFETPPLTTLGEYEYTIQCTGPGGSTTATHVMIVSPEATGAPPTLTLSANPTILSPGDSTALTWTSNNATSCSASGGNGSDGWSGTKPTASASTAIGPLNTAGSYSYTLTCVGAAGSAAKAVTVLVTSAATPPEVQVQVDVSPASITVGAAANLTWSTANADSCIASGNWAGGQGLLGSGLSTGNLALPGNYTYTLTCTGPSGTASASANLTVTAGIAILDTFTATPQTVPQGGSTLLSWTTTEATSCSASGGTGTDGWNGTVATSNGGQSIGPLSVPGTYTYTLLCTGPGGPGAPRSVNVTVNSSNPPVPSVTSFAASPSTILVGQAASLTWNTSGATSCAGLGGSGSDGWIGPEATSSSGTTTGPILVPGTYIYTLTCAGPGGTSLPSTAVVNVNPAPALPATVSLFTASPSNIQVGQSATLAWLTIGADTCTASNGTGAWGGSVSTSSSGTSTGNIGTAGSYVYTLTCSGSGGTGTPVSVTVNVTNPPGAAAAITSFTASPTTVVTGQNTTLAWTTSNATSCTASGGSSGDGWTGSVGTANAGRTVGPLNTAGSVTYTLNCNGTNGASAPSSVTVNVLNAVPVPSISLFTATPGTIQTGQSTSLTWAVAGATSCTASGGTGADAWHGTEPVAGTVSVGPINTAGAYTYTLTCTGPGGTGTPSSVVVNVNAVIPPAASVTSLLATPGTVLTGGTTVLTWSSDSATSCTATGGSGADTWHGSVGTSSLATTIGPLNTAGTYTYTLTCTGAGGTGAPQSVAVNVVAAPSPPVVGTFAVVPNAVTTGQTASISWVTLGATSCTASGGTGSDNWNGTMPTSNVAFITAPLSPAGNYTYTLTCTGAGGTSAPSSVNVSVTDAPTPPTISLLLATPNAVQTGGSTLFSWTALGATSCTTSGGTGTDHWGGAVSTTSLGTSIGPITPAGTYTYTLTCTGAGGSTSSSQTVTATDAIPAANITAFTAIPSTITTGQSVLLNWASAGATACTASGGAGSDGWSGSKPVAGVAVSVGPINTAGVYAYTLNCTGPGGASSPQSVTVTVNNATPAATVNALTAVPSTVQVGQSLALAWTTSNATSCTASGGTGSDGWNGTVGATSLGRTVGPMTTAGNVTYTLTCTGAGGTGAPTSTQVTVNPATPLQPTVALTVNGNNPATIQPGTQPVLAWTSSNALACVGSGGAGTDGWIGVKATSSTGVTLNSVNTPGVYTYTLTCTGAGGSGTSTAQVTVISSSSADCGLPSLATTALLAPAATVSSTVDGLLCVGCNVQTPGNVINGSTSSPAVMNILAGVLGGSVVLDVKDTATSFPAGRQVGFTLANANQTLTLNLLSNYTLTTYLSGTKQETASTSNHLLGLSALGLLSVNAGAGFAGFTTTKPFDEVTVEVSQVVGLLTSVDVYRACVSLN